MKILSKKVLVPVGILGTLALVGGAYIFQPWKLFIDTEVQESLPTVQQVPESATEPSDAESAPTESASTEPLVLAEGSLISHEYETSGTVKILQLADGSRVLRLENLDTSDGPRVEVWLTDSPVIEGEDGWRVFDDGNYESLGLLKGNQGNQNYKIPADLDLSDFSSVSLWCVTFSVSFGAAELASS
jgi:hypothetical protein